MDELIKEYRYKGKKYAIYGCFDEETKEGEYDHYDIYDENGECINLGAPLFDNPTLDDLVDFLNENNLVD